MQTESVSSLKPNQEVKEPSHSIRLCQHGLHLGHQAQGNVANPASGLKPKVDIRGERDINSSPAFASAASILATRYSACAIGRLKPNSCAVKAYRWIGLRSPVSAPKRRPASPGIDQLARSCRSAGGASACVLGGRGAARGVHADWLCGAAYIAVCWLPQFRIRMIGFKGGFWFGEN